MKCQRRVAPRAPIKFRYVIRGAKARFPVLLSTLSGGTGEPPKVAILETGKKQHFFGVEEAMPEEPSKFSRDADFTVCYDSAHMRSLGGGWSEDSTRRLKSGVSEKGSHSILKNRLTSNLRTRVSDQTGPPRSKKDSRSEFSGSKSLKR